MQNRQIPGHRPRPEKGKGKDARQKLRKLRKITDTLKSYRHYHDSLELGEKVGAAIHLIRAEDKKNKEGFVGWQGFTRYQEMVYEGFGNHHQMLSPGFIERNAVIIAKILREIRK